MKRLFAVLMAILMIISMMNSCDIVDSMLGSDLDDPYDDLFDDIDEEDDGFVDPDDKEDVPKDPSEGENEQGGESSKKYKYTDFTPAEKNLINETLGSIIPFAPNDEYYVEEVDGEINYYTIGNSAADFTAYRALYSSYEPTDEYVDDYGDKWYCYEKSGICVELSYYEYEGEKWIDVYAYLSDIDSGDGEEDGDVIQGTYYTDFTEDEKALLIRYIGEIIPFIPNSEYYIEGYYDVDDYENGINFYTVGNTKAEFEAYLDKYSSYELEETYEDEYGDTWYCYIKGGLVIDISYYNYLGDDYVDVFVYSDMSSDPEDGSGEGSDEDITHITNEGKGLPTDSDGVYDVVLPDAAIVKDVTDQGFYLDGCPTTGSPAVLVIPVEFSDATAASKGYSISSLVNAFCEGGKTDYYSLYDYYYISSYGKLTLDVTVLDSWFRPEYSSSYYRNATDSSGEAIGDQMIMDEALAYLESRFDLSRFDSDGNGMIDSIILVNTLDVDDSDNFFWAYRYWNYYSDSEGYYYEYDGVCANDYIWTPFAFLYEEYDLMGNASYDNEDNMNTYTFIHEFGHILGADDYYDTSFESDPLEGLDIMDSMTGDHNAFTKMNLGWITSSRLVVTESTVTLTLADFSKSGDTIIIATDWDPSLGAYQEYYIVMYYTNNGLNSDGNGYFYDEGIVVYHVNASLYKEIVDGEVYYDIYNNNTDPSDSYGTENNLIEFVKNSAGDIVFTEGDTLPAVTDDSGDVLEYTFRVVQITDTEATIMFTKK